jgi:hypothetical protein
MVARRETGRFGADARRAVIRTLRVCCGRSVEQIRRYVALRSLVTALTGMKKIVLVPSDSGVLPVGKPRASRATSSVQLIS